MIAPKPEIETFSLRDGSRRANPHDRYDDRWETGTVVSLSDKEISVQKAAPGSPSSWPFRAIEALILEKQSIGYADEARVWSYLATIRFKSNETLLLGVHEELRDPDVGDRDPAQYSRFIVSLHRRLAVHAPGTRTEYRGSGILQNSAMSAIIGIVGFIAGIIGALATPSLMGSWNPGPLYFVLLFLGFVTPMLLIGWLLSRILRIRRRYKPEAIPMFLLPESR